MVNQANPDEGVTTDVDVVVVGAGFAGLYMLHRLHDLGLTAQVLEAADDVGGTWFWNRYPGARCDIPTTDYSYSFDPELERDWIWSEKYATQPEILSYLNHVADRYDLRRDVRFSTRVETVAWDEGSQRWHVRTDTGLALSCRFTVMATGCLSRPKTPDVPGMERFAGEVYFTSTWPQEGVNFTGKRVAVIGTGSSGIQSIPLIAAQAEWLTVFQRTPNFSIPARNGPPNPLTLAAIAEDRDAYRESGRWSRGGVPRNLSRLSGTTATEEEARRRFEEAWQAGELFGIQDIFSDQMINPSSNAIVADLIREKIQAAVHDPDTAAALSPTDHPLGSKRPCLDSGYFETFNLPHVQLVDIRRHPISTITETGIETVDQSFEFDALVFATGFDAMTGALADIEISGRAGQLLAAKWAHGPSTYLGLTSVGFPNFFTVTGPGSPSVLSNMLVSIEQRVDWISECIAHLRDEGMDTIEPTPTAEAAWDQHVQDCAALTLYPTANSWYMGANVPGKPRVFLPYVGGVDAYRAVCDEVVTRGYLGFRLDGPQGSTCNDGAVRQLQPDVAMVLEAMATMELPAVESLSVEDARAFMDAASVERPPGPAVGEIVDGCMQGGDGELTYRLYRPASPGPHPVIAYFHGGGWVLGNLDSDDPLCRDLCVRTDAVVVSVDYRLAPEARFPAAAEDAFRAIGWIADHAAALGGIPGQLAVAGWSAGGNVAAVACQLARDAGGPRILGQALLMPVTDFDMTRASYEENADGYILTTEQMCWFWDHYADLADRTDARAAPLRGDLSDLPPALVVTADFDPLRDEGIAYAEALEAAGVPVRHLRARGHIHTSVAMVDIVISGASVREEMAHAIRSWFPVPVHG